MIKGMGKVLLVILCILFIGCTRDKSIKVDVDSKFLIAVQKFESVKEKCNKLDEELLSLLQKELPKPVQGENKTIASRDEIHKLENLIEKMPTASTEHADTLVSFWNEEPSEYKIVKKITFINQSVCSPTLWLKLFKAIHVANEVHKIPSQKSHPILRKLLVKTKTSIENMPTLLGLMVHLKMMDDVRVADSLKLSDMDRVKVKDLIKNGKELIAKINKTWENLEKLVEIEGELKDLTLADSRTSYIPAWTKEGTQQMFDALKEESLSTIKITKEIP